MPYMDKTVVTVLLLIDTNLVNLHRLQMNFTTEILYGWVLCTINLSVG